MTKKEVTTSTQIYFNKIVDTYGISKYHHTTPQIYIESSNYSDCDNPDIIAEFDFQDNEIYIYWKNIVSVEELIKSLIHEYQHYLQSPVWFTRYYNMGYDYINHPYELAANKFEEDWINFK